MDNLTNCLFQLSINNNNNVESIEIDEDNHMDVDDNMDVEPTNSDINMYNIFNTQAIQSNTAKFTSTSALSRRVVRVNRNKGMEIEM